MKRIPILLATLAVILAGCSKDDSATEPSQGPTSFKAGQKVTFTASMEQPATRATTNFDGTSINTKWEKGDAVLLTVGSDSANFTVTNIDGSGNATLAGTMPESGETFDLQYPVATPVLATQTYTDGQALPKNMMLYKATGCSLDATAILEAQYSALNLNFYGTGVNVKQIKVTTEASGTYILNFTTAKSLSTSKDNPTPFFIVVPSGSCKFTAEVYDDATTPVKIDSLTTKDAQPFTKGQYLKMPAKEMHGYVDLGLPSGLLWASCNVGASKPEEFGDYFAWGETEPYYSSITPNSTTPSVTWKEGKANGYDWPSYALGSGENTDQATMTKYNSTDGKTVLELADDAAHVNWGGNWRMPTAEECQELIDKCTWTWYSNENTEFNGVEGYKITATNGRSIFLPLAGSFDAPSSGLPIGFSSGVAFYRTSSIGNSSYADLAIKQARELYLKSDKYKVNTGNLRKNGDSVRPVRKK